jgi:thiamine-monophosphate kinase
MIDVSDGLLQDLRQICSASGTGAVIDLAQVPLSPAYRAIARQRGKAAFVDALTGGEDYELLFCASARDRFRIHQISRKTRVPIAHLGRCVKQRDVVVVDRGKPVSMSVAGHDHFRQTPV